jgi:hypothetical protein
MLTLAQLPAPPPSPPKKQFCSRSFFFPSSYLLLPLNTFDILSKWYVLAIDLANPSVYFLMTHIYRKLESLTFWNETSSYLHVSLKEAVL